MSSMSIQCLLVEKFRGTLDQCSVDVNCPMLFSKRAMKTWDVDLCFGKEVTKINKFGEEFPFSASSLPIINIFDFTDKDLEAEWSKIPKQFKIEAENN